MLIISVATGCVFEIGKYKDIYRLEEHNLAPKKRFGEFGQLRYARNTLAELALLFNRNNFKVSGGDFLKAKPGYMSEISLLKKRLIMIILLRVQTMSLRQVSLNHSRKMWIKTWVEI